MFFQSIENGAKSLYNKASNTFRGDEKIKFNKILNHNHYDVEQKLKSLGSKGIESLEHEATRLLRTTHKIPSSLVSKDHNNLLKTTKQLDEAIQKYKELIKMIEQQLLHENNSVIVNKKQKELDELRKKQTKALEEYKYSYEKLTRLNFAAQQIKYSFDINEKISKNVLEKTLEEKGYVNVDYYTLKRLAQNDQVVYKNLLQKNAYLRYIATILCFVVLVYVVGSLGYISFEITLYINFSLLLLGLCIIIYTYYSHLNDYSLSVYEKNFPNTGAEKGLSTVPSSCRSSFPSAEDNMWDSFFDIHS
jgi:hypothetical protein